jgi:hypothetical protein
MAGLSSIVNLGYHGTSPSNLRSIANIGFQGGTGQSTKILGTNINVGRTGKVYTSTPNVASTYGPRQIPLVQSAKHLKVPGGGTPGKTFTEALKNFAKTKFGFETALKPDQATKGMNFYNRLASGKYPTSAMAKRLLQTGTTAIKNPFNWAKAMNLPLSALTGILSSTPANADEQEWIDMMNERRSKNYGPWTQGTPHMQNQRFKQHQLMNRRKQDMQQRIREAEAAETNRIAKEKADAARAEQNRQAQLQAQVTSQANREAKRRISQGEGRDYGKTETRASSGWESSPFNSGGLVNFYRYGGFI